MKIFTDGNQALLEKAEPVENILSDEIQLMIKDMIILSMETGGHGIAAPQAGINKQIFVYRKSHVGNKYKVVINPKIILAAGKMNSKDEGCLSYPGFRCNVKRFKTFFISCLDQKGETVRINASNAKESKILQHEYDHLQGITIKTRE